MSAQFEAFATIGLFILLVFFVRGPWRQAVTDYARQVIFEHRDAIFDLAAEGKLSFEDPNYRAIRAALERNIRYAHEVSFTRFFVTMVWMQRNKGAIESPVLDKAISSIVDDAVREQVARHVYLSQRALVVAMVAKSPLVLALGIAIAALTSVLKSMQPWRSRTLRTVAREVQAEADIEPVYMDGWRRAA